MTNYRKIRIHLLLLIIFIVSCKQSVVEKSNIEFEKEQIRQADISWAKTVELKDLDAQMELYSDDQIPIMMPPNSPIVKGKVELRTFIERNFNRSDFSVTWQPDIVEVAESGDLGYAIGINEVIMNDSTGQPIKVIGKYIEIWKKQKDGNWKCVANIFNTTSTQKLATNGDE